jgi:hypothetical protein
MISFMTRAELLLWPRQNLWGARRATALQKHIQLFTTLFPDDQFEHLQNLTLVPVT